MVDALPAEPDVPAAIDQAPAPGSARLTPLWLLTQLVPSPEVVHGDGVTRFGLGQYPMKNALVALPPLETQQRIARFLDEKTTRIDGLATELQAVEAALLGLHRVDTNSTEPSDGTTAGEVRELRQRLEDLHQLILD